VPALSGPLPEILACVNCISVNRRIAVEAERGYADVRLKRDETSSVSAHGVLTQIYAHCKRSRCLKRKSDLTHFDSADGTFIEGGACT
jgi:hypothetical protein